MTTTTEAIPVHLYFLLDRSGSMQKLKPDVIGGFNAMLAKQRTLPGECVMTLVQFDSADRFELIHDAVPLADIPDLTAETFVPRGSTPLLDAEGMLIVRAEERVTARRNANQPPEAIVIGTYTDGMENFSRDWELSALRAKKAAHDTEWAFLYLGVGHDGYTQSRDVGTQAVNTVSAAGTSQGVADAMDFYVGEVIDVRTRAAAGLTTNSHETRASREAGRAARGD